MLARLDGYPRNSIALHNPKKYNILLNMQLSSGGPRPYLQVHFPILERTQS